MERQHTTSCNSSESSRRGPVTYPKLCGADLAWFALYVQVNHEKEVARQMKLKSIDHFLPLMEHWSKRRDRRKRIHTPLFPGYVFVHTVLDNYTNVQILRTPGAVGILRNSEGPLPIPDFQMESLQTMLNVQTAPHVHTSRKEGDWVQVVRGPLAGCVGILQRQHSNKGRLVVSIDIIQRSVSVELDVEDTEPLPGAPAGQRVVPL